MQCNDFPSGKKNLGDGSRLEKQIKTPQARGGHRCDQQEHSSFSKLVEAKDCFLLELKERVYADHVANRRGSATYLGDDSDE